MRKRGYLFLIFLYYIKIFGREANGILVLLIGILIPIIATMKGYVKSSIPLWLGFIALIFTKPWYEFKGFDGLLEAFILMLLVLPLYGLGILSWLIGFIVKREKKKDKKEEKK